MNRANVKVERSLNLCIEENDMCSKKDEASDLFVKREYDIFGADILANRMVVCFLLFNSKNIRKADKSFSSTIDPFIRHNHANARSKSGEWTNSREDHHCHGEGVWENRGGMGLKLASQASE